MADSGYEYDYVRGGFDVNIIPSDQGEDFAYVTLQEKGNKIFSGDISLDNLLDIEDAGQAAIDLFEAERGTLGLGAGAKPKMKGRAMKKKRACLGVGSYEQLYLEVRGTMFEEQTLNLLQRWIDLQREADEASTAQREIYAKKDNLRYEMMQLDLERLSTLPSDVEVVVIQARRADIAVSWEAEGVKSYMMRFEGSPLESRAVQLCKDYVDCLQKVDALEEQNSAKYDELRQVEDELTKIELEALQISIDENSPQGMADEFPKLTEGLMELAEGVPEALNPEDELDVEPLSLLEDEFVL